MDIQVNTDYNLKFSIQDYKVAFNPLQTAIALIQITLWSAFIRHDASAYHLLHEALRTAREAAQSNCEGAEFMHHRLQMSIGGQK